MTELLQQAVPVLIAATALAFLMYYLVLLTLLVYALWLGSIAARDERLRQDERTKRQAERP